MDYCFFISFFFWVENPYHGRLLSPTNDFLPKTLIHLCHTMLYLPSNSQSSHLHRSSSLLSVWFLLTFHRLCLNFGHSDLLFTPSPTLITADYAALFVHLTPEAKLSLQCNLSSPKVSIRTAYGHRSLGTFLTITNVN